MKCVFCKHGETQTGTQPVTFEKNGVVIVIKAVPGQICLHCGEGYFDQAVTSRLEQLTNIALANAHSDTAILEFTSASAGF